VPLPPIPVDRVLTPQPDPLPGSGYTMLDVAVTAVPQRIPLFGTVAVVVLVPTGEALSWLQADPAEPASSSDPGWAPAPAAGAPAPSPPARLVLLDAAQTLGTLPLAAGARAVLPWDGDPGRGALVDIVVLTWQLTAAAVVGAADTGSRLRLGWRRADLAPSQFRAPDANPKVLLRDGLGQPGAV
jgi:hypothetical protein